MREIIIKTFYYLIGLLFMISVSMIDSDSIAPTMVAIFCSVIFMFKLFTGGFEWEADDELD